MKIRVLGFLTLTFAVSAAMANAGKVGAIIHQQQEIREQSEISMGSYARFKAGELKRMHDAQDRIFQLLKGVSELDQLDKNQQAELFNAVEQVKAIIVQNEDDRQVCRRERKLGTTMKQTRCATVAELRVLRDASDDQLVESPTCTMKANTDCSGRAL